MATQIKARHPVSVKEFGLAVRMVPIINFQIRMRLTNNGSAFQPVLMVRPASSVPLPNLFKPGAEEDSDSSDSEFET